MSATAQGGRLMQALGEGVGLVLDAAADAAAAQLVSRLTPGAARIAVVLVHVDACMPAPAGRPLRYWPDCAGGEQPGGAALAAVRADVEQPRFV